MFPFKDNIPTPRFPVVTVGLIVVNVVAYFLWRDGGGCGVVDYAVIPADLTQASGERACTSPPTWLTPLTAMFAHDGLLQLAGNMLFLWLFGRTVEGALGAAKFACFYLLCGLAATALLVAVGPQSDVPNLGAAGAISGVVGGYLMRFSRARIISLVFIVFFVTIVAVPVIAYAGVWVLEQVLFEALDLTSGGEAGGAGYVTVLGGLAIGALGMRLVAGERAETERVRY